MLMPFSGPAQQAMGSLLCVPLLSLGAITRQAMGSLLCVPLLSLGAITKASMGSNLPAANMSISMHSIFSALIYDVTFEDHILYTTDRGRTLIN